MIKKIIVFTGVLFLIGCANSPYKYYVEPTPIKQGITKYSLGDVTVNLTLGHGAIDGDNTFVSQEMLRKQFVEALQKNLKSNELLADTNNSEFTVNVTIDYLRKFNHGGKALNKPEVSHFVMIQKSENKLVSFNASNYTTRYGYLKNTMVNAEIATFNWDAEDEPKDVNLIAELIVKNILELGK